MKAGKVVLIVITLIMFFVFLGCGEPPEQDWQWVEVAPYGGSTTTNNESLLIYAVNGPNPELWVKTIVRNNKSQKIFTFSKNGEQISLPVEVYDFGVDGVLQVARIFKYERKKVYAQLVYNLPKD